MEADWKGPLRFLQHVATPSLPGENKAVRAAASTGNERGAEINKNSFWNGERRGLVLINRRRSFETNPNYPVTLSHLFVSPPRVSSSSDSQVDCTPPPRSRTFYCTHLHFNTTCFQTAPYWTCMCRSRLKLLVALFWKCFNQTFMERLNTLQYSPRINQIIYKGIMVMANLAHLLKKI